ncbi:uncharacterized protein K02A2.6-like [Mizuhopecten yessoensis]|uniref:uncharacterized protein K02A2.6-like n=1 Tax=Mizuhopecten yessoensis TaxID=6573 RepID=UPI000B45F586|nr:uncharacterized protein K02A2.6-like [Mizuhopecten yessoensis]
MTVIHGINSKGTRTIIRKGLRIVMLDLLHSGHMGVEKCRSRAKDIMFWPGLSSDISELVLNCPTCLELRNSNAKEPMLPREIPARPWQIVATDLCAWNDQGFVVVVDYHSRYFEVSKLSSTTSAAVISKLKELFSRFGIPEKIISDNGPEYSSEKFREFAKTWDFNHETSSPHHPQSNGLAEKTVQTIKRLFTKAIRLMVETPILPY